MNPDNCDQIDVFISILMRQVKELRNIRDLLKFAKKDKFPSNELIELLQKLCDELKFNTYTLQELRDLLL